MPVRTLRIIGLPAPEAALVVDVLGGLGYRAVVTGAGCRQTPTIEEVRLLTDRQIEVLRAVREHGHDKGVAAALGIDTETVKSELARIYRRTGRHHRVLAVCWACRRGLLDVAASANKRPSPKRVR